MQVETEEVYQALLRLPAHKVTPTGKASTSLWRSCADILAPVLAQYTCAAHQVPRVSHEPKNLRPIGLTEAGGRAIARILQERLRPHSQYLHSIPQFAYLASAVLAMLFSVCNPIVGECKIFARHQPGKSWMLLRQGRSTAAIKVACSYPWT